VLATAVTGGALAVLATAASAEIYDGVEDGEGPTPAILLAIAAAGSVLISMAGKHLVAGATPAGARGAHESSPSFPSGHTLNSWVLWILTGYLVAVRTGSRGRTMVALVVAVVLAIAMRLSRVYLEHHWPTDVLIAWTVGTWLVVIVRSHRLALSTRRWTSGSAEVPVS
jgi:undecaprenyl-diphosphatase